MTTLQCYSLICPSCKRVHPLFFGDDDNALICACGTTVVDITIKERTLKANLINLDSLKKSVTSYHAQDDTLVDFREM